MPNSDVVVIAAVLIVAALLAVVTWQLGRLRRLPERGAPGRPILPGSEMRQLEDGSWEVFLVRNGAHREAFDAIREERQDDVRLVVELRLAGRRRTARVAVVVDGAEVGQLHSDVAAALAPALGDGPVSCTARVRTRTSRRTGDERSSLSVIVPAPVVAAAGHRTS